jgi:hypothetical protein
MTIAVKEPIDAICAVALHHPECRWRNIFTVRSLRERVREGDNYPWTVYEDVWDHRNDLHCSQEFIFNSMFQSSFTPILPGTCML